MRFDLRLTRGPEALRFDTGYTFHWRKLDRRARRVLASVASHTTDGLRDGFSLLRYAEDAALLEALRAQLAGKGIKQAARNSGRMRVKAVVLFAASREGRRLHALVDQMEERLVGREAVTLCG